ncbi:polar amino acid transport system substrate-binding protein [Youngiibacter multivorans]|uniref:Polar amino acid transport system substrate-binding protein n=2 Tax=Youngiibacter multivorans TaxID=937251 RepID=A0ABS4G1S1_9CLOT|nr:transporter substrate-binding domain-containing protein [Youngiibacter multivorans]MBP1918488.1 polar amino acid transport system substrate-binding protein [Youngiibacter multivorans]
MKKSIKRLVAASVAAMAIFAAGCGSKTTPTTAPTTAPSATIAMSASLKKIKDSGKLVLGTSADYPPFEFHASVDGKDTIVGFDIEVAKEIAKDLGVTLEIKDLKFDGLLAALDQGSVDIVIAGLSPTEERAKSVDFSIQYYSAEQAVVVRGADKGTLTTLESLKGKTIAAQKGTIQEDAAKAVEGATVLSLGKISDLILALKSNRADAAIIEVPVAESNVKENTDLVISSIVIKNEGEGKVAAVKKGSADLVVEVNKTLERILADGTFEKFVLEATQLSEK